MAAACLNCPPTRGIDPIEPIGCSWHGRGVYESQDGGDTFEPFSLGLPLERS